KCRSCAGSLQRYRDKNAAPQFRHIRNRSKSSAHCSSGISAAMAANGGPININGSPMTTTPHKRAYRPESRQKCRSYTGSLQRYRDRSVAPTQGLYNAIATKMSLLRRVSTTLSRQKCRSYKRLPSPYNYWQASCIYPAIKEFAMINNNTNVAATYTDLNALQGIRKLGKQDQSAALMEVAKQFESMFVNMMMSSMRDASAVFEEDSLFSSPEGDFYQQMYDDQMALSLSNGGGMGLAPVIHRQLMSSYGNVNKDRSELPLDQGKLHDRRISVPIYQP